MYKIDELSNGVKTVTVPMSGTKTATILVMVGTGSKYEDKNNNGISHFLEHMFFKGTRKRPSTLIISSELDAIGSEYNAFTGKEYTGYWVKSDASKMETVLDIVSDMLLNSKFDSAEVNREKGVIIEEINMYFDNPMMHVEDVLEECIYGNTPAGWDTLGTKENVLGFTREDIVGYFKSQYGAHNITLCLAGNIGKDHKQTMKMLGKYFSSKELSERDKHFREKISVVEAQKAPAVKIFYKKTDQAHFALGSKAMDYAHKDKMAAKLLSVILGGSMSSRLYINLRERRGLAYYLSTSTENYTDSGYMSTRAGVAVEKIYEAIKLILLEYKKIGKTAVGATELKRTKDLLRGRLSIGLEASDAQANWYARQAVMFSTIGRATGQADMLKKEITDADDFLKQLDKVSAEDIQRVAKAMFRKENLNLAVAGPFKDSKKFKDLLKF